MAIDQPFHPAKTFEIDDLETFKLLMADPRVELIELLRSPATVAELAVLMDVPRTRLYHHINVLEEAGAIVVVDEHRSGAATEKVYQVAAETFRPSESFLESATARDQAAVAVDSLFAVTRSDLLRAIDRKHLTLRDPHHKRRIVLARSMLTLTPERTAELVGILDALLEDFSHDEETDETAPFGVLIVAHPSSRSLR